MVTATGTAGAAPGTHGSMPCGDRARRARRHERLVREDQVQRLKRQLLGPRKDPETGEWSKKHRAGTCGLPHGERVEMGYATVPGGLDAGQLRGAVDCAAANLCLRCAIEIGTARARQIRAAGRRHESARIPLLDGHPRPSPTPAATAWPSATRT